MEHAEQVDQPPPHAVGPPPPSDVSQPEGRRDLPPKLGEVLVAAGVLSQVQLIEALQEQRRDVRRRRLGEILLSSGVITEGQLTRALSGQLRLSYVDLPTMAIPHEIVSLVPRALAERHQVIPIGITSEGAIILAMANPTDLVASDDVRVASNRPVKVACARPSHMAQAISRYYRFAGGRDLSVGGPSGGERPSLAFIEWVTQPRQEEPSDEAAEADEAATLAGPGVPGVTGPLGPSVGAEVARDPLQVPAEPGSDATNPVDLVDVVFEDAVRAGATDIHVEPRAEGVDVRFRVDGLLQEMLTVPKHLQAPLVDRIKSLASLDVSERRRPQDGRIVKTLRGVSIDARVSTMPTLHGEKLVLNLVGASGDSLSLDKLGFSLAGLTVIEQAVSRHHGIILVTGPKGSGRTSTVYALLGWIHRPHINAVTVEDRIRRELPDMVQVQVDKRAGMTMAEALRSALRQDPDLVMVSEIKDQETAEVACEAAAGGKLVLATMQTNDAPTAITRLVDMGVEPALIASALSLVMAQRLLRRVCEHCKQEAEVSPRVLDALGIFPADGTLVRGEGCFECHYTGYQGRTAVYQLLEINELVREQILTQVSERTVAHVAETAGSRTLQEAGVDLALQGVTTAEEVVRVLQTVDRPRLSCPGCGAEVQAQFVVCPFCHTEISVTSCRGCNKELMPGWTTCPFCATRVGPDEPRPTEDQPSGGGNFRILVVEDDDDVRRVLEVMLVGEGYTVMAAGNGEEALRIAARHKPHVILLDVMLPDKSGIDVCRELRALPQTSLVPVIFLTARSDMQTELAGFEAGGDDYLVKPIDRERLLARIHTRLRTGALT